MVKFLNPNDSTRDFILDGRSNLETVWYLDTLSSEQKDSIISLFLSDFYKIGYIWAKKSGDMRIINKFMHHKEDLMYEISEDPNFLVSIIQGSKEFKRLSLIDKVLMFDVLKKDNQDAFLAQICKNHCFDYLKYNHIYDLDLFKEYYINLKNENYVDNSIACKFASNKLLECKNIDYEKYKELVLEFIKVYYKWTFSINKIYSNEGLYENDLEYLKIIEESKLEELFEYAYNNYNFLYTIIDNYLYYSTSENLVSDNVVDDLFYKEVNSKTLEKLKIKK